MSKSNFPFPMTLNKICSVHMYLWFLHDLDEIHVVLHGVDDDQHVSKVSRDDATPVVPAVLRPHYVHLVVSQVT